MPWFCDTVGAMVIASVVALLIGIMEKSRFVPALLMLLTGSGVLMLGAMAGPTGNGYLEWVQDFLRPPF